jgi:hypothetical protein
MFLHVIIGLSHCPYRGANRELRREEIANGSDASAGIAHCRSRAAAA